MNNNSNTTCTGIGFTGVLAIVFIVLKLVGVIDWKWVWVLAPIWIAGAITLVIIVAMIIIAFISEKRGR